MNKIILTLSGLMIIGLILSLVIYQKSPQSTTPQMDPSLQGQGAQEGKQAKPEQLQPILVSGQIGYSLQNNELNITFDKGANWEKVPVEKDQLFEGEYNGNKEELIEHSFILTENRLAFIYIENEDRVMLLYSDDKGTTWQRSIISGQFTGVRFRKAGFLNDTFGYAIISGGRTMAQEGSVVFLTKDGGKSWEPAADTGNTSMVYDGGFVDEKTGFISFANFNPDAPDLFVTRDGGGTWEKSILNTPPRYDKIFTTAEIPVKEGDDLAMLINQGPNGDYQGGRVKGKFISKNNGKTWDFSEEVQPIE